MRHFGFTEKSESEKTTEQLVNFINNGFNSDWLYFKKTVPAESLKEAMESEETKKALENQLIKIIKMGGGTHWLDLKRTLPPHLIEQAFQEKQVRLTAIKELKKQRTIGGTSQMFLEKELPQDIIQEA